MVKKIPILLLIILATTSVVVPQAFAEEEKDYWTYEEMVKFEKEVEPELFDENTCNNKSCLRRLYASIRGRGGKYTALLNGYDMYPLVISAINPSKGTISVIYRGSTLRDKINGFTEEDYVINLFISRFDEGKSDGNFYERILNGEELPDSVHLVILEREENNGEKWLDNNKETTFQMIDATFSETIPNKAWFYFETANKGKWLDPFSFDSCLKSPDYREGMECRVVYTTKGTNFIPQEVSEPTAEPEPVVALEEEKRIVPLVPDTGMIKEAGCSEMPWWVVALVILGGITLIWWLLPTKYEKSQKKSKKLQKKY